MWIKHVLKPVDQRCDESFSVEQVDTEDRLGIDLFDERSSVWKISEQMIFLPDVRLIDWLLVPNESNYVE